MAAINAVVAPNSLAAAAASQHSINSSSQLSSSTGAYPKQQPRQLSLDGGPACQTVLSLTELAAREVASSIPFELVERYYPPVPEQVRSLTQQSQCSVCFEFCVLCFVSVDLTQRFSTSKGVSVYFKKL